MLMCRGVHCNCCMARRSRPPLRTTPRFCEPCHLATATWPPFQDELCGLLDSPSYAIREIARAVGERLGLWHTLPMVPTSAPLPAFYRLSLPPSNFRLHTSSAEASETEALPDAWDSLELVRPLSRSPRTYTDSA